MRARRHNSRPMRHYQRQQAQRRTAKIIPYPPRIPIAASVAPISNLPAPLSQSSSALAIRRPATGHVGPSARRSIPDGSRPHCPYQRGSTTNPAYSLGSVRRVGGSGLSDCFDVGKWVSRPFLQRGNLCHGPHPPGAMIARRDFRFQRSGARRSQPRSTEVGSPRMAVFCCWHRPSARWGFAGGLRLALPIRAILRG